MFKNLKDYIKEIRYVCEFRKWDKGWSRGGCYMHLEVSEFIEALRGKGDPVDELGDVLFTVLAVADYHGIDPIFAIEKNVLKHRKAMAEINESHNKGE